MLTSLVKRDFKKNAVKCSIHFPTCSINKNTPLSVRYHVAIQAPFYLILLFIVPYSRFSLGCSDLLALPRRSFVRTSNTPLVVALHINVRFCMIMGTSTSFSVHCKTFSHLKMKTKTTMTNCWFSSLKNCTTN